MIEKEYLLKIASHFSIDYPIMEIACYGNGLINSTYLILTRNGSVQKRFILQKINTNIFKNVEQLLNNFKVVEAHLQAKVFKQKILALTKTKDGKYYQKDESGFYWRLFPFIENTSSIDTIENATQAYEGAKVMGDFLGTLWDLNPDLLALTIPDFHNTALRYQQFETTIVENPVTRNILAKEAIHFFKNHAFIFKNLPTKFPLRVTHNDTKISNVLLDQASKKGIAVIDWDTLMPGWIIHDFGDMVRTFTNPVGEESKDFSAITSRIDLFQSLTEGFLQKLHKLLTPIERENLVNGALVITYEQGLRFLTDYLKGDPYYSIEYPTQNLIRASNQIVLLKSMLVQQLEMEKIVSDYREA